MLRLSESPKSPGLRRVGHPPRAGILRGSLRSCSPPQRRRSELRICGPAGGSTVEVRSFRFGSIEWVTPSDCRCSESSSGCGLLADQRSFAPTAVRLQKFSLDGDFRHLIPRRRAHSVTRTAPARLDFVANPSHPPSTQWMHETRISCLAAGLGRERTRTGMRDVAA